uniref:Uncharacterized protein n=1 Tax=Bangia fuscopurpurea TaxID=101920 RepID=A0A0E3M5V2_BANFU|nr:hypothetical protein [Bangia fuscopurpurea]AKA66473.1 hypothetical protein [Bangia fuscopurpurea]
MCVVIAVYMCIVALVSLQLYVCICSLAQCALMMSLIFSIDTTTTCDKLGLKHPVCHREYNLLWKSRALIYTKIFRLIITPISI